MAVMADARTTVRGIDFVAIPVADMTRAAAFYREILGLRQSSEFNGDWVEFDAGGVCLGLVRPEAFGGTFSPLEFAPVALRVDDVAAALDAFAREGKRPHFEDTSVCHMGFLKDSEGNALILHRRYAPEPS